MNIFINKVLKTLSSQTIGSQSKAIQNDACALVEFIVLATVFSMEWYKMKGSCVYRENTSVSWDI